MGDLKLAMELLRIQERNLSNKVEVVALDI